MKLTIVMYHYVRPLESSRFPGLKALDCADFDEQLSYITRHHSVISGTDLLDAATTEAWNELPPSPALLTFDDGYVDHFTHVLPLLQRRRLSGCFFVSGRSVLEHHVLDVNKIHFVLASAADKRALVDRVLRRIERSGPEFGCRSAAEYWRALGVPSRFDTVEVAFLKRALQRELPAALRVQIVDELFRECVTTDEAGFAAELYLSLEQIACMRTAGMYFGSHGYAHSWLSHVEPAEQQLEVARAVSFLRRMGTPLDAWIMSYPHGAHNASLLALLRGVQCRIGLTTHVGIAELGVDDPLALPRLNTNDLPRRGDAQPSIWTEQARPRATAASRMLHAADL